ncbi:MAG TPA: helix-turn-helix transcriptional regulator [Dehalococcoidia bacterium]|nr:helix-turn-helix transcriptional regulator [Dehalococcoidia bacterium]
MDGAKTEQRLPDLLQAHRVRRGLSQTALAQRIGVTPSTINRFETGARDPGQAALLAIGRALELDRAELDALLRAAGEPPLDLIDVGVDDPDLRLVLSILADPAIPPADREEFRWQIRLAARRWRPAPDGTVPR